jgi:hypothetical protein
METTLLCYIYLASASWRSELTPPLPRSLVLLTIAETIENDDSDAGARSRSFLLPLASATAAWLTTSQAHYVTLDHCLLDYSCQ